MISKVKHIIHEVLYENVHSSFIYITQKLETTQSPLTELLLFPCNRILLNNEYEQTTD